MGGVLCTVSSDLVRTPNQIESTDEPLGVRRGYVPTTDVVPASDVVSTTDVVPFAVPDIGEAEIDAAVGALRSGWLTTGPQTKAFESEFSAAVGAGRPAVAVNSATAGLHLALEALGIGPGDEVIVPTWTFTATAEVVRYLGADPVMVDVRETTLNMSPEAVIAAITPRTRAIIPVHFAGLGAEMTALTGIASKHDLVVVEDAAHALPCRVDGQMVGSGKADATVFSFYATKTITTGEGGMIVCANAQAAERMTIMRLHGINRDVFDRYRTTGSSWRYEVVAPGFKYNLTDPAAAIGRVQLRRASIMRDRRAAIAAYYTQMLSGLPIDLPAEAPAGDQHAWHLYVARVSNDSPRNRDELIDGLNERGIGTSVHFIPLHLHPYWQTRYQLNPADFPVASAEFERVVSLPLYSAMTDAQVERVVKTVSELLG